MTLYVLALVFSCLVAVGAMFTALRAVEHADKNVREAKIRSHVNSLAADYAILRDDLDSLGVSIRKLRNRENARHARDAGKSNGQMSDADFLRAAELGTLKGAK